MDDSVRYALIIALLNANINIEVIIYKAKIGLMNNGVFNTYPIF